MTDTSKLAAESAAISDKSPAIKTFAKDAAANLVDLAGRVAALEHAAPIPTPPTPTPTPAPVPTPTGVPIFDGRARTYIAKYGTLPYVAGTGTATSPHKSATDATYYAPPTFAAYTYMKDDIRVTTDPDLGPCFLVAPPSGDHNPWNTGAPTTATSAQVSHGRAVKLGTWEYFATALKMVLMDPCDWSSYLSLNYETLMWDQIELGGYNNGTTKNWIIYRHTGTIPVDPVQADLKPIVLGQAERFVIALKQAADNTGEVQVWNKAGTGAWTMLVRWTNVPTYLLGSNSPYGSIDLAQLQSMNVLDKAGMYTGTRTPAPTQKVLHAGWSQWATLADAQASLG